LGEGLPNVFKELISFNAEIWLPWQPKGIIRINLKNLLVKTQRPRA
jgi:hypothetical protein